VNVELKERIEKQMSVERILNAINQLTGIEADKFIEVLERHLTRPENKRIEATFRDNITIGLESIKTLLDTESEYVPIREDLLKMLEIAEKIQEYLEKNGEDTDIAGKLKQLKNLIKLYLERIEPYYDKKSLLDKDFMNLDESDPNELYKYYFNKYLKENISLIKKGFNPKVSKEEWEIDDTSERGKIQTLALTDSNRTLLSGVDFSRSRGNLDSYYGLKSREQVTDEKILKSLTEKKSEEKSLSDIPDWLMERIKKRIDKK